MQRQTSNACTKAQKKPRNLDITQQGCGVERAGAVVFSDSGARPAIKQRPHDGPVASVNCGEECCGATGSLDIASGTNLQEEVNQSNVTFLTSDVQRRQPGSGLIIQTSTATQQRSRDGLPSHAS